jgi:hypothetical protein
VLRENALHRPSSKVCAASGKSLAMQVVGFCLRKNKRKLKVLNPSNTKCLAFLRARYKHTHAGLYKLHSPLSQFFPAQIELFSKAHTSFARDETRLTSMASTMF